MQDNCAERLSTIYILHSNWLFKTIYAIVQPFLTQRTKSKMRIVNKTEDLLKYFDPSELLMEHEGLSNYKFIYQPQQKINQSAKEMNKEKDTLVQSIGGNLKNKFQEEKQEESMRLR